MFVYWLLLAFPSLFVLGASTRSAMRRGGLAALGLAAFMLYYVLLAGLRYQTGGDWLNYQNIYDAIDGRGLGFAMTMTDPLFGLLNWISAELSLGMFPINFICPAILLAGVVSLARRTPNPWLAITLAVPYILIVIGFGYIRQAAAIGSLMIGINALIERRMFAAGCWVVSAILWHATAIVVLPVLALAMGYRHRGALVAIIVLSVPLYIFVLSGRFERFEAYTDGSISSAGALVRLLMGAWPALILLFNRRKLTTTPLGSAVWTAMAATALILPAVLLVRPDLSTTIDRIGLYFVPVQVLVFGYLTTFFGTKVQGRFIVGLGAIFYCIMIQLTFLNFGVHAELFRYKSIFVNF